MICIPGIEAVRLEVTMAGSDEFYSLIVGGEKDWLLMALAKEQR